MADRYDAGTGASSFTFNLEKMRRFINRILWEKKTLKTALRATVTLDDMSEKAVVKSGLLFEVPVRRALSGTTKTFNPYDNGSDFVGDSPYVGAASGSGVANTAVNTYTPKDAIRNMEIRWSFAHDEIRFSNIYLTMLDSPGKFLDYFSENMDYISDGLKVFMADQQLRGTGDGLATNSDFYGLYNQDVSWSGDRNATGINNDPSNTHFNLERHAFPALVGNVWPADAVWDPASAGAEVRRVDPGTGLIVTDPATDYAWTNGVHGTVFVNGGTEIRLDPAATPKYLVNADVHDWYVDITILAGTYAGQRIRRIIGHGWADIGGGAAEDTIQVAAQIFDPASAVGALIACDVQIRPRFNLTEHGDAGVSTLGKLQAAYFLDGAADGNDFVNRVCVNASRFVFFMNELQQIQRWYGEDAHLNAKGFRNFMFNAAAVVIDNYEDADVIRMANMKYQKMAFLRGYDEFMIRKNSLRYDTSGRRIDSMVGDVVIGGQFVDVAPHRSPRIVKLY